MDDHMVYFLERLKISFNSPSFSTSLLLEDHIFFRNELNLTSTFKPKDTYTQERKTIIMCHTVITVLLRLLTTY